MQGDGLENGPEMHVEQGATSNIPLRSLIKTVVGSSLLWAWGYLCYLSPVLFPFGGTVSASTGLEYGFFASQAAVVLCAVVVMMVSRRRPLVLSRWVFLVAAMLVALTTAVLVGALRYGFSGVVVGCGIVDGVCVLLMGVAWGARYSLGSRTMRPLVVVSFLFAYLFYLVVAHMPQPWSVVVVLMLPLCSWALWISDASARHEVSSEVFPVSRTNEVAMPGELTAGTWEAKVLPWQSIGVLVAAAFIGNLMASVIIGWAYDGVDSLFYGGVVVCACIATMSLLPLATDRNVLSVGSVYRITLTFTAVGLVAIMVFEAVGVPVGGALVQGSAFFLQVLVFLVITQSTQEQGLSPLLAFSVGQALISAVVFLGNVLGKQIYALFGSGNFVLDVVCGGGLLALFFMLVARASAAEVHLARSENTACSSTFFESNKQKIRKAIEHGTISIAGVEELDIDASEAFMQHRLERFAETYHLTKREAEVLGFLVRGRSLPYIADTLFVTTGTIKTHTVHIYRKLRVNSRQELLDLFEKQIERDKPTGILLHE